MNLRRILYLLIVGLSVSLIAGCLTTGVYTPSAARVTFQEYTKVKSIVSKDNVIALVTNTSDAIGKARLVTWSEYSTLLSDQCTYMRINRMVSPERTAVLNDEEIRLWRVFITTWLTEVVDAHKLPSDGPQLYAESAQDLVTKVTNANR